MNWFVKVMNSNKNELRTIKLEINVVFKDHE